MLQQLMPPSRRERLILFLARAITVAIVIYPPWAITQRSDFVGFIGSGPDKPDHLPPTKFYTVYAYGWIFSPPNPFSPNFDDMVWKTSMSTSIHWTLLFVQVGILVVVTGLVLHIMRRQLKAK